MSSPLPLPLSLILPLQLPVLVVVDRIEPPMAVIEWPDRRISDVPLALLPVDIQEGTRLLLQPAPTGLSSCPAYPLTGVP